MRNLLQAPWFLPILLMLAGSGAAWVSRPALVSATFITSAQPEPLANAIREATAGHPEIRVEMVKSDEVVVSLDGPETPDSRKAVIEIVKAIGVKAPIVALELGRKKPAQPSPMRLALGLSAGATLGFLLWFLGFHRKDDGTGGTRPGN